MECAVLVTATAQRTSVIRDLILILSIPALGSKTVLHVILHYIIEIYCSQYPVPGWPHMRQDDQAYLVMYSRAPETIRCD
jgi:hypothetical protein